MTVTAFVGVTTIPMDGREAVPGQTVVTDGDRIMAAGPSAELDLGEGTTIVDGVGRFLLPGLADMKGSWPEGSGSPNPTCRGARRDRRPL